MPESKPEFYTPSSFQRALDERRERSGKKTVTVYDTFPVISPPYRPGIECCELCVFGRGEHAKFCEHYGKKRNWDPEAGDPPEHPRL